MAAAIVFGVAAAILAAVALRPARAPEAAASMLFSMAPPESTVWRSFNSFALSPDGKRLVYYARDGQGIAHLYLRSMDALTAQPLPGTDVGDAGFPFWSPDSRVIGFFAGGKLKKIDAGGGPPQVLCDAEAGFGGTWNRDGVILFAPKPDSPIMSIPASGGEPSPVTRIGASGGKESHEWPFFLPDGRRFLYVSIGERKEQSWVMAGSLGSGSAERLIPGPESQTIYAPSGHLLFVRDGSLVALPFDAASGKISGEPLLLADHISLNPGPRFGAFSAASNGLLVYRSGSAEGKRQTWFDRSGKVLGAVGPTGEMEDLEISPDGRRVAFAYSDQSERPTNIWILDLVRGTSSRFSFGASRETEPLWSADGSFIYFVSAEKGHADIYRKPSSGAGQQEIVFASEEDKMLADISTDGRYLAFTPIHFGGTSNVFILPLQGEGKPYPLMKTASNVRMPRFSPDGRFVAYVSDETGRDEIYVVTFPQPVGKWQVSTNGGSQPRWRSDGREIYYLAPNSMETAVSVSTTGSAFEAGLPVDLFPTGLMAFGIRNHYTVSADGQRFLVGIRAGGGSSPPLTFVVNWPATLKK